MSRLVRVRAHAVGHYVVDAARGKVYAGSGRNPVISATDLMLNASEADEVLASLSAYDKLFEWRIPGNVTPDGKLELRGELTTAEEREFASQGVAVERSAKSLHLDFFDQDQDGYIGLRENYRGWRQLGFPWHAAALQAVLSSLIFAWRFGRWSIAIDALQRKPSSDGTRIFDGSGRLDREILDGYLDRFRVNGGILTFKELEHRLRDGKATGLVSRRQFQSMFRVCKRLNNGREVVTTQQFEALFDGGLLWLAAAVTERNGRVAARRDHRSEKIRA